MKRTNAPELYEHFMTYLREKDAEGQEQRNTEVHISDLLTCMRKSYLDKTSGRTNTDDKVLMFLAGKGHHDRLEAPLEEDVRVGTVALRAEMTDKDIQLLTEDLMEHPELRVQWNGIIGTMDGWFQDAPVEIKTNRAFYIPKSLNSGYIDQLKSYCVMVGRDHGYIAIFYINHKERVEHMDRPKTAPCLSVYKIQFSAKELLDKKTALLRKKRDFDKAMQMSQQPPMLDKKDKWLCDYCDYLGEECEGNK